MSALLGLCLLWIFVRLARAETHPQTVAVPPLQWIRLSPTGTNPSPALAYAAAGFDFVNNQLVLFGGETSAGLIDSNTHLLDLNTLSWTSPSPTVNKNIKPPGRSRALSGHDIMASYRNGLLVYGGHGQQGPLSDVWEYVFSGQFWYNVTDIEGDLPSARYGATGGGDPPSASNNDPNLLTTFWLTGGVEQVASGPQLVGYEDIYRLQMSGTIAANFQNAKAQWKKVASTETGTAKPRIGQAGLVFRGLEGEAKLGMYGGCASGNQTAVDCAQQDAHIISTAAAGQWSDIPGCPSARIGAAFVPNLNPQFTDSAFLLSGLSPVTNATDVYELGERGEIDVLGLSQGTWTRVLPSCDPSSTPRCPVPREGAAVVSSAKALVGTAGSSARSAASDIIMFGGKDKDGNVLNDIWLLRATTAQILHTNQTDWGALYGNGVLGSGVDVNGRGVTVEFLEECAHSFVSNSTGNSSGGPSSGGQSPPTESGSTTLSIPVYVSGTQHKVLAGTSVVLVLSAVVLWRGASGPNNGEGDKKLKTVRLSAIFIASIAWILGVTGFATSFTSTARNPDAAKLFKRSPDATLGFTNTPHAIVGCILFALVYVITPLAAFLGRRFANSQRVHNARTEDEVLSTNTRNSMATPTLEDAYRRLSNEKRAASHRTQPSIAVPTGPTTPQDDAESAFAIHHSDTDEPVSAGERTKLGSRRLSAPSAFLQEHVWPAKSWGKQSARRDRRISHPSPPRPASLTQSQATTLNTLEPLSTPPESGGGFVVLNRGKNALDRRTPPPSAYFSQAHRAAPQNLSDVSWLERRRNVNQVSEWDYAMTRLPRDSHPSPHDNSVHSKDYDQAVRTPGTINQQEGEDDRAATIFDDKRAVFLHCLFHSMLFTLGIYTAASIFMQAGGPLAVPLGAVFVVALALFYFFIVLLAMRGKPSGSILVEVIRRLRSDGTRSSADGSRHVKREAGAASPAMENGPATVERSPALNSTIPQSTSASMAFILQSRYSSEMHESGGRAAAADEQDDAESIEREMGRRDVSIITVPRRRLFIANSDTP